MDGSKKDVRRFDDLEVGDTIWQVHSGLITPHEIIKIDIKGLIRKIETAGELFHAVGVLSYDEQWHADYGQLKEHLLSYAKSVARLSKDGKEI